ncbi:hypothetical protein [Methylococcus capsulatus]|jgi:hypothetical protein|uniref:Uncharacterized protein n=1 Tax=Methylococcus capsulatus TaxID=414 RepID=A0AA35UQL7_METCP|nr:hypothetical protein [Methylococcus capsulatus]QXP89550.1 hypothetical protein KW114_10585 [Methylococcus capsulatus]CAI8818303.1 protein of unknown function [Methylococcus capsulatus]
MTLPVGGVTGIGGVASAAATAAPAAEVYSIAASIGQPIYVEASLVAAIEQTTLDVYAIAASLHSQVYARLDLSAGVAQAVVVFEVFDAIAPIRQPIYAVTGFEAFVEQVGFDGYAVAAPLEQRLWARFNLTAPVEQSQFRLFDASVVIEQRLRAEAYRLQAPVTHRVKAVFTLSAGLAQTVADPVFDLDATVEQAVYAFIANLTASLSQTQYDAQAVGGGAFVGQSQAASADITAWAVKAVIGNAAGDGEPVPPEAGAVMGALLGRMTGTLTVDGEEGAARIAEFTVLPAPGPIHIHTLTGLPITLFLVTAGVELPIFQGILDVPGWDPVQGLLHLSCTDNLQSRFDGLKRKEIAGIIGGRWSPYVFDKHADEWQYVLDRLSTLPVSYDLDLNLQGRITPWQARATADFTFRPDAVIENSVRIDMASARQLVNAIDVHMDYRYERLMQREYRYHWELSLDQLIDQGSTAPTPETVMQAIDGTGWAVLAEGGTPLLRMTPLPDPQWLHGVMYLSDCPRYSLAGGVSAILAQRWTQTVTEQWHVTVDAPDSIRVIGKRHGTTTANFDAQSDKDPRYAHWDRTTEQTVKLELHDGAPIGGYACDSWIPYHPLQVRTYTVPVPAGAQRFATLDPIANPLGDLYYDLDDGAADGRAGLSNAYMTGIERARRDILSSHRQTTVTFDTLIAPLIDRTHTVRMASPRLTAKGKVRRVTHSIDFDHGAAITTLALAVSKSYGVGTVDTGFDFPAPAKPPATQAPLKHPLATPAIGYDPANGEFTITVPGVEQQHIDATTTAPADHLPIAIPDDELILEA